MPLDNPAPKSTYQTNFQSPVHQYERPRSSHGTMAREGIMPVTLKTQQGIEGTRFLSEFDIVMLASLLPVCPFPEKPYTAKEMRMLRKMSFQLGNPIIQTGGALIKKFECKVKKQEAFVQCQDFTSKDLQVIVSRPGVTYASLWKLPGTIAKTKSLRLDIQNPIADHQNLQVQVNKKRKPGESTSVSTVLLHHNLGVFTKEPQQKYILRKVRNAFLLSGSTGHKYEVKLDLPSPPTSPTSTVTLSPR